MAWAWRRERAREIGIKPHGCQRQAEDNHDHDEKIKNLRCQKIKVHQRPHKIKTPDLFIQVKASG
jgi:hypothetical protein